MSLFEPFMLGGIELKNRFVRAPTYEARADEDAKVTDALIKLYRTLARGEVGLIVTGYMFVHPHGRAQPRQIGIHTDEMIPGLKQLVGAVHEEGGRIAFELSHAGRQTTAKMIGRNPIAPSRGRRDPVFMVKPDEMTEEMIQDVIRAFREAARRACEAGADSVYIHASGGYLIHQFLSPFFNLRRDRWGGSDENRFRFLKEVILAVKEVIPTGTALLVKICANDHTPREGTTPPLARVYAQWLDELGIDGLEIASGTISYSNMNNYLGDVPVRSIVKAMPLLMRPLAWLILRRQVGKYDLEEGWNLEVSKTIKTVLGRTALIIVGGLRRIEHMQQIVEEGHADLLALCRPLIRDPYFVKKLKEGKTEIASCRYCNQCMAAVPQGLAVRCYGPKKPATAR